MISDWIFVALSFSKYLCPPVAEKNTSPFCFCFVFFLSSMVGLASQHCKYQTTKKFQELLFYVLLRTVSSCGRSRRLCWFNKRPTLLSCCFFCLSCPLSPCPHRLCVCYIFYKGNGTECNQSHAPVSDHGGTVSSALSLFSLCKWLGKTKVILSCSDC